MHQRLLLALAAACAALAGASTAAAAPIAPATFCLDHKTVTFTDTAQVYTHGWRALPASAISFYTTKATTTGTFLITDKNDNVHTVSVSLGACPTDDED